MFAKSRVSELCFSSTTGSFAAAVPARRAATATTTVTATTARRIRTVCIAPPSSRCPHLRGRPSSTLRLEGRGENPGKPSIFCAARGLADGAVVEKFAAAGEAGEELDAATETDVHQRL